jgi:hypothetical protein
MIAAFALVAWPAEYDKSEIMAFIVNHRGKVYQKDLGPETAEIVAVTNRRGLKRRAQLSRLPEVLAPRPGPIR